MNELVASLAERRAAVMAEYERQAALMQSVAADAWPEIPTKPQMAAWGANVEYHQQRAAVCYEQARRLYGIAADIRYVASLPEVDE